MLIVVVTVRIEFPREVRGVPEENLTQVLTANGSNQMLDERMKNRNVWNGLDLFDIENP